MEIQYLVFVVFEIVVVTLGYVEYRSKNENRGAFLNWLVALCVASLCVWINMPFGKFSWIISLLIFMLGVVFLVYLGRKAK